MVYVLNIKGEPLMPCKNAKARKLLRDNKAIVVRREPFTIKLNFVCENVVQDITLGIDAGSKFIGVSATTKEKELFSAEVELRNDISKKLLTRRQNRRTRRNRLRYRQPRFLNRVKSKNKGWLAPSIEHKIQTHITIIKKVHEILPINKIIVETAQFDIQKINNPNISGEEYQQGNQLGYGNVKEYVLFRDSHKCQYCKGKSKETRLEVHHITYRSNGGSNKQDNLITLCKTCHKKVHNNTIELKVKKAKSFKHATFMGIMRKTLLSRLDNLYPNIEETYGYITKSTRIESNLEKEHRTDARCISGNPLAIQCDHWYYYKKVRCQNRQTHRANFISGHRKKLNQAPFAVKGFRLFDLVEYNNKLYYIFGRRSSGLFDIRRLDGTKVNKGSISYKKMKLIQVRKTMLIEKRCEE